MVTQHAQHCDQYEAGVLFDERNDMCLHMKKITIYSGNDNVHVSKCEVSQNHTHTMDIKYTCQEEKSQFDHRPRELDVRIDMEEDNGQHRTLNIYFHKGKVLLDWCRKSD
jgi:hypothetical protein